MKNKCVLFMMAAFLAFAGHLGTADAQSLDAESDRLGFSMVVQNGHANTVNAVRFSPDGNYLASGGGFPLAGNFTGDCSVKVTRVSDGIILKNLSGHEANVNGLAFSPDGSLLASVSTDRTLRVWRLDTGSAAFVSPEAEASLTAVCFSPDGRYAAALGQGASYEENPAAPEIRIYDVASGMLKTAFRGPSRGIRGLSYVSDGSGILLMYDEKAEIWSPSSRARTRSLPACGPVAEKNGYFHFLKRSGPDFYDVVRAPVSGGALISSGTLSSAGYPLSVSPDGEKYLFFPGENYQAPNEDSRFPILLIDQAGGGKKHSIIGHRNYVLAGDFSPDGSLCATGGSEFDGSVRVHSAETGETLLTMRGNTAPLHWVGASNNTLFAGSIISDVLYRWNLGELRLERVMPGTLAAAVTGDGSHVLYRGGGGLKKDRVDTGRSAAEFAGVGTGYEMGLSSDGNLMAFPVQDGARLFDARTGKALRSLSSGRSGFRTEHLAMSPDGLRLAAAGADGSVQVFDCGLGKVTAGYEVRASAISFSWDSRYLIVGDYDGDVYLKDIQTGKGCSLHRHTEAVRAIASSPSWPGIFVTGSTDRTIRVWQMREQGNLDAGFNVQTLSGHGGAVTSLSFTPDAKYLVSASDDGVVRVWNTKTWEAVNLLALSNGEWIVYTDDGYFDASASGGEYLAMVRGMTPYRVDQFALYANRPDIILSRMGLGSEDHIRYFKALYEKRISKSSLMFTSLTGREVLPGQEEAPRAEILSLGEGINAAALTARFSDAGGVSSGIVRYNVYVNDVPLFGGFGREIPANAKKAGGWITVEEHFPLVSMKNKIEVSCYNDKGIESLRAVRYMEGSGDIVGDLYFLGIGVSEYADPAIQDLRFAHKDALDLVSLFSGMEGYFSSVHVKTLTDAEATRSASFPPRPS
jgi:WD40 repeat protein